MPDLLRLARRIRCNSASPEERFRHRLRIGAVIAVLILILSLWR